MTSGFVHEASVSDSVEWYTPAWVFTALATSFTLDPCSPGEGLTHVPAERHLTQADDGLTADWDGMVWCNPPYGRGIEKWLEKCISHAARGGDAIALVPNRTDTRWWQYAASLADGMTLLEGRVKFHRGNKDAEPKGSPGTGSTFFAFGTEAFVTLRNSTLPGLFIDLRKDH